MALGAELALNGAVTIALVVVTHYDADRVEGIARLLEDLADARRKRRRRFARIGSIWFNHFLPVEGREARRAGESFKDVVPRLALELDIAVNEPFDYFVMPSEHGPARVKLEGGLDVTVVGPDARWLRDFYRRWRADQDRRGLHGGSDLVRDTDLSSSADDSLADAVATISEGFSSPRIELLRAPPTTLEIPPPPGGDMNTANLSSIVTLFEFGGRRALFCGDGRCDHIFSGLSQAQLVLSGSRLHLDLIQLPHWGSVRSVSQQFFELVTADHYVITSDGRFRLPSAETLDLIARARGMIGISFISPRSIDCLALGRQGATRSDERATRLARRNQLHDQAVNIGCRRRL